MTFGSNFDNILPWKSENQITGAVPLPAQKAHRQSVKRYARNMSVRRATRTAVGRARRAIAAGAPESEEELLKAMRQLDLAARKGVLHKNNAARRKSRLAAALNRARAS